ncbi:MAG: type I DNA topoisomerase [Ardenticatenaceae bacterium]|nr:type I DNA topoisomerase [Ardenticatenaceae bacterium]
MSERLEAYCVKCREKRAVADPQAVFTAAGGPATRGRCSVCGTTLFRMGATPAHEGMTPPEPKPTAARRKQTKSERRRGKLVIVESPTKARTIGKFLGRGYTLRPSVGHVRDLLKSRLSVDVEHNFEPTYRVPNEKKAIVKELRAAAESANEIYLATDPDREGEAIAWHLLEAAELPRERTHRVVFHEITRSAIAEAFAHPKGLDMNLVSAQQARRILDRLVGYGISPLLWRKVRSRLSAGRVQSVTQRMIVDREREIRAFVPVEYWTIAALLAQVTTRKAKGDRPGLAARLVKVRGEEPSLPDEATTMAVVRALDGATYVITDIRQQQRRRNPAAPFTTSTLQQEASRRLGFGARKAMTVAQQLYEGLNIGDEGTVGLITYMRTDSVNVSQEAQAEARTYIAQTFGEDFVPATAPIYKSRAKNAQEAHEAIRPTSVLRTPDAVASFLDRSQFRLYELIWKRFVASQMAPAVLDITSVDIAADTERRLTPGSAVADEAVVARLADNPAYLFRASGSVVRFQGFLALYEEGRDDAGPDEEGGTLPDLTTGELLDLLELQPDQHFTQPPPRYTEATLVKALEENGIGRPSTYAAILSTIQDRGYVTREQKRLMPTELGEIVNDLLVEHFPDVMDIGFTAQMEEELDQIAEGEREWHSVVGEFYGPFSQRLEVAAEEMEEVELEEEETDEICEKCGARMIVKFGRFGKFIACPNFPACRNTKPYFQKIGVRCPEDGAELVEKRTRKGRVFYGCSNYPDCEWSSWKRPVPQPCLACGGLLVEENRTTLRCLQCESTFDRDAIEAAEREAV